MGRDRTPVGGGVVEPLRALLGTTEHQALEFFVVGLSDVCESAVDRRELFYTASVLAHHTLVSTQASADLPTPAHLGTVFDQFVADTRFRDEPVLMEHAATQCLLLSGFFADQMRGRHNLTWYATLGAGFFDRAAACERSTKKADLLTAVGRHFEPWRQRFARLSRELRDQRYLLEPPRSVS